MGGIESKGSSDIRLVRKLHLLWLLAEASNFRNDGWVQQGYKERYKKALTEFIRDYASLRDLSRE